MPEPPAALRVRNLRKSYSDVVAVDGIDLEVATGECFGLLGPNGAGKTTTIEICEGLTDADSGDVELLGFTWKRDSQELRQRLGIQLQETQLSDKLSVQETIRLFRSFFRKGPQVADVICRHMGGTAREISRCLLDDLDEFTKQRAQDDDQSLIVIRVE